MIYISFPYDDPSKQVMNNRYLMAMCYSQHLLKSGFTNLSLVIYIHHMAKKFDLPIEFQAWKKLWLDYLNACDEMHVLMIDGWQQADRVKAEKNYYRLYDKKIIHVHDHEITDLVMDMEIEGNTIEMSYRR